MMPGLLWWHYTAYAGLEPVTNDRFESRSGQIICVKTFGAY